MTNDEHKSELISLITSIMKEIDLKQLHSKNKVLLYTRYVLLKLSWHPTVAKTSAKIDFRKPGLDRQPIYPYMA